MRLQVFLSHSGACSRRRAMEYILSGRVRVNGQAVREPSYAVDPSGAAVTLDGKSVVSRQKVYLLLNKPAGVVTSVSDPFAEKTVLDLLPASFKHVYPVGRLDRETTGLLLLTNDGDLAHRLSHPSFEVKKTYSVKLDRDLSDADKGRLERGIVLEGKKTSPCRIRKIRPAELEMTIHEGRKRQIRKMCALLRYRVVALSRVRQGPLELGDLKVGAWRLLTASEVAALKKISTARNSR